MTTIGPHRKDAAQPPAADRPAEAALALAVPIAWIFVRAAPLALVVAMASWIFLGDDGGRPAVVLSCIAVLGMCVLAVGLVRLRSGPVPASDVVAAAVRRAASPGAGPRGVPNPPQRIPGNLLLRLRSALYFVSLATVALLFVAMGLGTVGQSEQVEQLRRADAVIETLRVDDVTVVERTESRNHHYATVDIAVRLPVSGSPRATFRIETGRPIQRGDTLPVAYAPSRPEIGAIGDVNQEPLAQALEGRTFSEPVRGTVLGVWAFLVVFAVLADRSVRGPVHTRWTVGSRTTVVRAEIVGVARQRNSKEREGKPEGSDEETSRHPDAFTLETSSGPLTFKVGALADAALPVVRGEQGWLVRTHPRRTVLLGVRRQLAPARFVSDHDWVLHGAVPLDEIERSQEATSVVLTKEASDAVPGPAERDLRVLDPTGAWPAAAFPTALVTAVVALVCAALLVFPEVEPFRGWVAAGGGVAALLTVACLMHLSDTYRKTMPPPAGSDS